MVPLTFDAVLRHFTTDVSQLRIVSNDRLWVIDNNLR